MNKVYVLSAMRDLEYSGNSIDVEVFANKDDANKAAWAWREDFRNSNKIDEDMSYDDEMFGRIFYYLVDEANENFVTIKVEEADIQ